MAVHLIPVESTFSWQRPVLEVANAGVETKGNRYIVGAAPTGTFIGLTEHDIVYYDGTAWVAYTPEIGWRVYDIAQTAFLDFNGTAWEVVADVDSKMDLVPTATEDNLVSFNGDGNAKDSGVGTPAYDTDLGMVVMSFA